MQFFTPQLYQQFNSHDEAESDHATEAWEQAILAYNQYLETFRRRMPSQVLALSTLCLHDAEVLARAEINQTSAPLFYHDIPVPISIWSAVAVISLQLDGEILSLFYCLWDRARLAHLQRLGLSPNSENIGCTTRFTPRRMEKACCIPIASFSAQELC